MKIKQLREALRGLSPEHDEYDLVVWLPGSRVDLCDQFMMVRRAGEVLVEGNVRSGSALEQIVEGG